MTKDPYKYYRIEARELVDGLSQGAVELGKGGPSRDIVVRLLRLAHTLKGASRVVKQGPIAELAHAMEDVLAPYREGQAPVPGESLSRLQRQVDEVRGRLQELGSPAPAAAPAAAPVPQPAAPSNSFETVRVDLSEMDAFLDSVTELETQGGSLRAGLRKLQRGGALALDLQHRIARPSGGEAPRAVLVEELRREIRGAQRHLAADVEQLEARIGRLHESAHQMRLLPVSMIFPTLERAVIDAASSVRRLVSFRPAGGEHRLDAQMLGALRDALLHVVRNAVAHGIESAAERAAAGKPAEGVVRLEVEPRDRRLAFLCSDDGRGIDVDAVRAAALRQGLVTAEAAGRMGIREAVQILLQGGITTTSGVTELSGRAIGLDVLRETVARLRGELSVTSTPGRGTTVEIIVPISLASRAVLRVEALGATVLIPLESIVRTVLLKPADITRSLGRDTIRHENRIIPLMGLADLLGRDGLSSRKTSFPAVIVRSGAEEVALRVDRLVGAGRAVVRPLPAEAQADAVLYGASLNSDGNPELALDPAGLLATAGKAPGSAPRVSAKERKSILVIDDSLTTRMLEQSILETAGYEVDLASSGEEGLTKARQRRYALFICDVEMPGISGFEFISRTRAEGALKDVPAILVTSLGSPEDRSRGKRVGARAYIVKSEFDQGSFMQIIRGLIE